MVMGGLVAGLFAAWDLDLPGDLPAAGDPGGGHRRGLWGFIPGMLKAKPARMR